MAKVTYADPTVEFDRALVTTPKPRAFRAHLYDESGTLAHVNGIIYFVSDDGAITAFEPQMATWCTVLGEVGLAEVQAMWDRIHGGPAHICVTREIGRS